MVLRIEMVKDLFERLDANIPFFGRHISFVIFADTMLMTDSAANGCNRLAGR